jgi:predicted glutamine amidotransferase
MAVIATAPLTTGEPWVAFLPGELKLFVHGAPLPVAAEPGIVFQSLPISY